MKNKVIEVNITNINIGIKIVCVTHRAYNIGFNLTNRPKAKTTNQNVKPAR